mmetsp:Transcript_122771/g.212924  ORF Transcript_122771/g.212924 Transcript_122771/m.212924 type:complete len:108 (+) Transcript_122771:2198-2521(+)
MPYQLHRGERHTLVWAGVWLVCFIGVLHSHSSLLKDNDAATTRPVFDEGESPHTVSLSNPHMAASYFLHLCSVQKIKRLIQACPDLPPAFQPSILDLGMLCLPRALH